MKKIDKNSIVTLEYKVTDPDGEVIDEGKEPLIYLHGGYDGIFVSIEEALQGKSVDDSVTVKMQPAEAFGEYEPELVTVESVDALPQPLTVGMQIEGALEGESENAILYRVTDIAEGKAVLDGNHPLAGMALVFKGKVTALRPATPDEIKSGQALCQV
ncbi:MAG: peptidylprolyl isomerase [Geobacteraceae bacterium GWC2_48_7]|nr:MAG: peptidylprolyl isomerase [Geobacteraceae bacterium GWC2_48_7]